MKKKLMGTLAAALALLVPGGTEAANVDSEAARNEAVALARNGSYAEALVLMREVEKSGYEGAGFWADYMTVLSWAGEEQELVRLADAHYAGDFTLVPDYALIPIARAYEHTGDRATAIELYKLLAEHGNTQAELSYANLLAKAGENKLATEVYDRLRKDGKYSEQEISYNEALDALYRRDYVTAERLFAVTRAEAERAGDTDFIRDMDARRAALYINDGEANRAGLILAPYVDSDTATSWMLSDYLMALRLDNQPKKALAVFKAKCTDWSAMPAYGLQTVGDIYLRQGDYKNAHKVYSYVLEKNDIGFVRLGDAYALAILGDRAGSMAAYRQAITRYPNLRAAAAGDMAALLRLGKLHEARGVYMVLTEDAATRELYQLRYGQALVESGETLATGLLNFARDERMAGRDYYYEAERVLAPLQNSADSDISTSARAALAHNHLNHGRYATGSRELATLMETASDHPEVLKVASEREWQLKNSLTVGYASGMDNKRNRDASLYYDYSHYLGGNASLLQGTAYHWLEDGERSADYRTTYLGLDYDFHRGSVSAAYDFYWGESAERGFNTDITYNFSDVTTLSYSLARRPHAHAGALINRVMELAQSARLEYIYGSHWRLGADYELALLDDNNRYWNWGVDATRSITLKHNYRDNLIMNYSYGSYQQEVDTYDSPYRRVDYAIGVSRKWSIPEHQRTWEWINMLGWGHDNDEGTSFGPWTRLEFVQDLRANQQLRAGAQYSWYVNQIATDDNSRRSNGYRFDVSYYVGW